ncbi:DUF3747 domain-containing protein [Capilliphycus salinus ALCB114379]|uniref:DUF3747 domain-containing protein n=1 Tax=Capilliphycus salinus TaxID=2768948 RepID=UPI0039A6B087
MKRAFQRTFAALALTVLSTVNVASEAFAVQFGQKEVEQERYVAMAVPRTYGYSLVIVEQVSNTTPCWSESGSNPIQVDPLLLNFDFTGICGRATDSNGYSVRMGGEDLALSHSLSVRGLGGEILLVATSRDNPYSEPIVIGRTNGMSNGFVKIVLEPGWRFTKRTYQDKTLGHIYFTHDYSASAYSQMVNPTQTDNRTDNSRKNTPDNSTSKTPDNNEDNTAKTPDNNEDNTAKTPDNSEDNTAKTADKTPDNSEDNTAKTADNSEDNTAKTGSSTRIYNRVGNRGENRNSNSADKTTDDDTETRVSERNSERVSERKSSRVSSRVSSRNSNSNSNNFFNRSYDKY